LISKEDMGIVWEVFAHQARNSRRDAKNKISIMTVAARIRRTKSHARFENRRVNEGAPKIEKMPKMETTAKLRLRMPKMKTGRPSRCEKKGVVPIKARMAK